MPNNKTPAIVDQASRLRELTLPESAGKPSLNFFAPRPKIDAPRFTLLSEAPGSPLSRQLAWQMAAQLADAGQRSLVVDLMPSASILPGLLASEPGAAKIRPQPLWQETATGRGLARWQPSKNSLVDVIAQPIMDFPTTDQLSRIYEQLLRRFEMQTESPQSTWTRVILISDLAGIPLDRVCWTSAEDIVILTPAGTDSDPALSTLAGSRLSEQASNQRRLMLWKQPRKLGRVRWTALKRHAATLAGNSQNDVSSSQSLQQHCFEHFDTYGVASDNTAIPLGTNIAAWTQRCVARGLLAELDSHHGRLGLRQAS